MTTQATPDLLTKFAQYERRRGLKLCTIATALLNIVGVLGTLQPALPTAAHYRLCRHVKAASQREAPAERFLVDPADLLEVGLQLLDTAVDVNGDVIDVDAWQDGLMLALLTVAPMRMANFSTLQVGQQLVQRGEIWCIDLNACETKTRQDDLWPVPPWLAPYLQHHVDVVRLHIMSQRTQDRDPGAVWIDRFGQRLQHQGIRQRIKARTMAAFGRPVLPHSFRHCAATAFSWSFPDRPRDAAALLGHGSPRTTEKHYIRSQRQLAVAELHRMIGRRIRARGLPEPDLH